MSQINNIGVPGGESAIVETLTGNSGGAVGPDASHNINVLGSGAVTVVGVPASNTLTISVSGTGLTWTDEAISFSAAASNGYFCTAALTATLPASPSQGDTIAINTVTSSNVVIQANTGQTIVLGLTSSTTAGTCTSSDTGNSIELVYRSTGSTWRTLNEVGTWILA